MINDRSWMRVGFGRYCADSPCCPAFVQEILITENSSSQEMTSILVPFEEEDKHHKQSHESTQKCFWWRCADWNFNCTWLKGQWKQRSSWRKRTGPGIAGHFSVNEAVLQCFFHVRFGIAKIAWESVSDDKRKRRIPFFTVRHRWWSRKAHLPEIYVPKRIFFRWSGWWQTRRISAALSLTSWWRIRWWQEMATPMSAPALKVQRWVRFCQQAKVIIT